MLLHPQDEESSDRFISSSIDDILTNNTRVMHHMAGEAGSTFSKVAIPSSSGPEEDCREERREHCDRSHHTVRVWPAIAYKQSRRYPLPLEAS